MTYLTRSKIVELDRAECWSLLRSHQYGVGRVAFNAPGDDDGPPEILPVNYLLDGADLIVQTGTGVIHDAVVEGVPLSFELDSVTQPSYGERQDGWSVVAKGPCELVSATAQKTYLRLSHLAPAAGGFKPNFVRMTVETLTGRRI